LNVTFIRTVPSHILSYVIGAIATGNAAPSSSKFFWAKLVKFGQIWLDLGKSD